MSLCDLLHLRFASWLPRKVVNKSVGRGRLFVRPLISRLATAEDIHYWTALHHIIIIIIIDVQLCSSQVDKREEGGKYMEKKMFFAEGTINGEGKGG